jgi:hypothetical protein
MLHAQEVWYLVCMRATMCGVSTSTRANLNARRLSVPAVNRLDNMEYKTDELRAWLEL